MSVADTLEVQEQLQSRGRCGRIERGLSGALDLLCCRKRPHPGKRHILMSLESLQFAFDEALELADREAAWKPPVS